MEKKRVRYRVRYNDYVNVDDHDHDDSGFETRVMMSSKNPEIVF